MTRLHFVDTGDDLIEGVYNDAGELLQSWSPNDANWRSEYFNPLMERLGFTIVNHWGDEDDWTDKLRRHAMELWGLTEEDVGLND